jgi:nickel transport protein
MLARWEHPVGQAGWRNMQIAKISILLMSMIGLYATGLQAHGVSGIISRGGLVVTATYDSGDPMSYSKVTILAPDADLKFQSGRTDRNGRFCFYPDSSGQWKLLVDDGMGHRLSLDVEVGADVASPEIIDSSSPMTSEGMPRTIKVVSGLCIIFGLSGFLYGWKTRRTVA